MPIAAIAITKDLSPSDTFMVTELDTRAVSADNLLTNSPVFVTSKKDMSCFMIALNTEVLKFRIIL